MPCRRPALAPPLRFRRNRFCHPRHTKRNLMAPPELAGNAPGPDIAAASRNRHWPNSRERIWSRPSPPPRWLSSARAATFRYHCSVRKRLQHHGLGFFVMRHRMGDGLDLVEQASRVQIGHDLLARRFARKAAIGRGHGHRSSVPSLLRMLIMWQAVALADLEIVEVVRWRDFDRAGALFRIGIFVGDDRHQAVRSAAAPPCGPPAPCSVRHPDAPPPPCRPAWFRAWWWRW